MKLEHADAYLKWLRGIDMEISFWSGYLKSRGGPYGPDFEMRLDPEAQIGARDPILKNSVNAIARERVRILDVGAGPLTGIGKRQPGKTIELSACDPLAELYRTLLTQNSIEPPVKTQFADAENLSLFFAPRSFDVACCINALDHSYDPLKGIAEMLKVIEDDGIIHLGHAENEAEFEQYKGFHQWNFTAADEDFIIWNKDNRFSLSEKLGSRNAFFCTAVPFNGRRWIVLTIWKSKIERPPIAFEEDLSEKYRLLLQEFIGMRQSAIGWIHGRPIRSV